VRKMKREDQFGTGPDTGSYTLPKVRPAINEGGHSIGRSVGGSRK